MLKSDGNRRPWGQLTTRGVNLLIVAAVVAGLLYNHNRPDPPLARIQTVLIAVGPLIVAACVLIAAGAIVDAIRSSDRRTSDEGVSPPHR